MIDLFTYFIYLTLLSLAIVITYSNRISNTNEIVPVENNRLKLGHFTVLILISFIVGFRFQVGIDWGSYRDNFYQIAINPSLGFWDQSDEPLFFYINKLVAKLGLTYQWMFFLVAFISWYFIFKSVQSVLIPFFIFFLFTDEQFFWSMNGVRQFVACAIFLCSLKFVVGRNFSSFFFYIVLASLFHYSALFLIIIYFVPFQKVYNRNFWLLAFILSFYFSQSSFFTDGLKNILIQASNIIPIIKNYIFYLESGFYESRKVEGTGLGVIFKNLINLFIIYSSHSFIKKYPQTKIYFVLFFFGSIINNIFFTFQIIGRINVYFMIIRSLLMALLLFDSLKTKSIRRELTLSVSFLYFVILLLAIYNSSNQCTPFRFKF